MGERVRNELAASEMVKVHNHYSNKPLGKEYVRVEKMDGNEWSKSFHWFLPDLYYK